MVPMSSSSPLIGWPLHKVRGQVVIEVGIDPAAEVLPCAGTYPPGCLDRMGGTGQGVVNRGFTQGIYLFRNTTIG